MEETKSAGFWYSRTTVWLASSPKPTLHAICPNKRFCDSSKRSTRPRPSPGTIVGLWLQFPDAPGFGNEDATVAWQSKGMNRSAAVKVSSSVFVVARLFIV